MPIILLTLVIWYSGKSIDATLASYSKNFQIFPVVTAPYIFLTRYQALLGNAS
jgi:hypothetical protein